MPGKDKTQALVEMIAVFDKTSMNNTLRQFRKMTEKDTQLTFRAQDIEIAGNWTKKITAAVDQATDTLGAGLLSRFDREVATTMRAMVETRAKIADAELKGQSEIVSTLLKEEAVLEKQLALITDSFQQQSKRVEKLKEEWKPGLAGLHDSGQAIADQFTNTLGHIKSNDLAGFTKAIIGGLAKGAKAGAGGFDMAAAAAGTEKAAAALGTASAGLAAAAGVLAIAAGAIAAVVAVMAAADSQAKDFNKTLLDGAGMADVAFSKAGNVGVELTDTLSDAAEASQQLGYRWRMESKEFAGVLSEMNKAGLTIKEMTENEKAGADAAQVLAGHLQTNVKWSKALGVSTAEVAELQNRWSADFGMDLEQINEQFALIGGAAERSGMGTKRFFTAVSQATSGMALYNNRVEEAAGLLMQTAKILGETDATNFIQTLTKGFADESYVDRFKRIMISGVDDVKRVMHADAMKMATDFSKTFGDNADVQGAFKKSFGESIDLKMLGDPDQLMTFLGNKSDKQIRDIVTELRAQGQDQAARQIESTAKITKAQKGGVTEMAKGLDELSMGGKLAVKMQGLGNKRISEMSGIELAAFEQYSGIGGEQLEQLRRMDAAFMGEWDAINAMKEEMGKGNVTAERQAEIVAQLADYGVKLDEENQVINEKTGQVLGNINDYTVMHGELLEDTAKIQDKATAFAQSSVQNTTSILTVLQVGVQGVLKDIYDIMTRFYNAYMGLSPEALAAQQELLAQNADQQESAQNTLDALSQQLDSQQRELRQASSEDQRKEIEGQIAQTQAAITAVQSDLDKTRSRGQSIASGEDLEMQIKTYQAMGKDSPVALAANYLTDYATNLYDPELMKGAADAIDAAAAAGYSDDGSSMVLAKAAGSAYVDMATGGIPRSLARGTGGPSGDVPAMTAEQLGLSEEEFAEVQRQSALMDETLSVQENMKRAEDSWQRSKFEKKSTDAMVTALRKVEATKLAQQLGFSGANLTSAVDDILAGGTQGYVRSATAGVSDPELVRGLAGFGVVDMPANDFIMRPGQAAQRFSAGDTVVGMKDGGPLAGLIGGGGGGNVNITINGGDQARVYQTVKEALKSSGLRPGR